MSCYKCGKQGHFAAACRSVSQAPSQRPSHQAENNNWGIIDDGWDTLAPTAPLPPTSTAPTVSKPLRVHAAGVSWDTPDDTDWGSQRLKDLAAEGARSTQQRPAPELHTASSASRPNTTHDVALPLNQRAPQQATQFSRTQGKPPAAPPTHIERRGSHHASNRDTPSQRQPPTDHSPTRRRKSHSPSRSPPRSRTHDSDRHSSSQRPNLDQPSYKRRRPSRSPDSAQSSHKRRRHSRSPQGGRRRSRSPPRYRSSTRSPTRGRSQSRPRHQAYSRNHTNASRERTPESQPRQSRLDDPLQLLLASQAHIMESLKAMVQAKK